MQLGNILKKAKRRLAIAAIGVGSVVSVGCDLEDYLSFLEAAGISDKSDFAAKYFSFGVFDFDSSPHRMNFGLRLPYDSGINVRFGRDNLEPRFHVNVQPYAGGRDLFNAHIYPQDHVRGVQSFISSIPRGSYVGMPMPTPYLFGMSAWPGQQQETY